MRAEFILLDWICIDEGKAVIVFVGDQRRRLNPIRLSQLPNTRTHGGRGRSRAEGSESCSPPPT